MSDANQNIINNWAKEFTNGNFNPTSGFNFPIHASIKRNFSQFIPRWLASKLLIKNDNNVLLDEFKVYKETWKILDAMKNIKQFDTDNAWNKLYDKISDDKEVSAIKTKTIKLRALFSIAATIVILIGLVSVFVLNNNNITTYVNSSLAVKTITLPDGSEVSMNTQSEISFDKSFGNKSRNITLLGEAFFKVTKDPSKPFVVQSGNAYVKVLGTSFNVNAKGNNVKVVVKTGRVEVSNKTTLNQVILMPGDEAILVNNSEIIKQSNVNYNYLSWLDKKLIFKALPMSVVINDLMKTYNCNIELSDSSIKNYKLTSTFDNIPLTDVLESISLTFNLSIENVDNRYILVQK